MDELLTCSGNTISTYTISGYPLYVSDNLSINKNNNMKEEKLTLQKAVFLKTVVKEYTYECLAESHEDLLKKIENGCSSSEKTISVETVEVK